MSKFNEYMEMAKRSMYSISQNLVGDTEEDAIKDFISKAKRSRYSNEEIVAGLKTAFAISKKQAAYQLAKYNGIIKDDDDE